MENCILFGNGINRCYGGLSWESLLTEIARSNFISSDTHSNYALAFDQLLCSMLACGIDFKKNDTIAKTIKKVGEVDENISETYNKFLDLGFTTILTTNFDYSIEKSIDYNFSPEKAIIKVSNETKRSNKRHYVLNEKNIFHIHGELNKPNTICLGITHYAYNLNIIIDAVTSKNDDTDDREFNNKVFSNEIISWGQKFFNSNIFIVGLGLSDCDLDLWWVISYRAKLLCSNDSRITNKITYFYLYEEKDEHFIECLKNMKIDVREYKISDSKWLDAYNLIPSQIRNIIDNK